MLWLLIDTRSHLLVVGLLSIAEPLCPSWCLFGTILVALFFMVWDWRVSIAEPMLSCWHDLLFIFCFRLFYLLLLLSTGWLCGVGVFGLIECSLSRPCTATPNNNNNNNNNERAIVATNYRNMNIVQGWHRLQRKSNFTMFSKNSKT